MEAALLDLARIASERTGPMVAPPAVPAVSRVATTTTTTSRSAIVLDPPVEDDERGRFDWFLAILSALTAFWLVTGLLLVAGGALAQGTPASAAVVATPTVKSPLDPTPTQPTGPTAGAAQAVSILVPSMIGLDSDRARRIVEDQGLRYTIDAREFNDDIPENGILRQDPPAGTALNRGDEVKVVLSRGVQTVAVPTLTGLTADEASRRAVDAGLTVERTEAFSDTVRSGSVISQSPAANQRVRPGTAVTLTVSRGPNRPVMPDVIGRPLNEALQILQQAGLRVPETNINRQGAEQVPDSVRARFCVGCVMSTDPVTGANIVVGQDVRIAIRRE
jgi:beta-lactam-binding protein with PASTA domain